MGRTSVTAMAARTAAALAERKGVLDSMTPALKTACRELQASLTSQSEDNVRFYHRLGKQCLEIREQPEKYLTEEQRLQNVDPFSLLSQVVSVPRDTFRKTAQFAEQYTQEDLQRFFAYRNQVNPKYRLHWGHVVYLLSVTPKSVQVEYEERAVKHMWDPKTLHDKIMEHFGGPRASGGRPRAIPKTVPGQIKQILDVTKTWLSCHRDVWHGEKHSVFANVLDVPPDRYSEEMLQSLRSVRAQMHEVAEAANNEAALCDRVIDHVQTALQTDHTAAAAAAETAAGGKPKPVTAKVAAKAPTQVASKPRPGTSRQRPANRAAAVAARAAAAAKKRRPALR